jgi:TRAP-type mannitol/chloroaromatic compound transport system permease large subunit
MVQRAFGAMTNETLLSIPLFVLMGYVMERGALVDRMFYAVQLAFRGVPGSLAVATLVICTFWGIASGLVGAVVVLMGVIAMRPMLNAGYDTRLAAGVITAGGTLGILIPPSVMIIVYAAVAGQSVVKLYAAAMFPGFFLALLYVVYVIGWAMIQPKVAPRLPIEQQRGAGHAVDRARGLGLLAEDAAGAALGPGRPRPGPGARIDGVRTSWLMILRNAIVALVPFLFAAVTLGAVWWYVTIHSQPDAPTAAPSAAAAKAAPAAAPGGVQEPPGSGGVQEPPGSGGVQEPPGAGGVQEPPGSSDLQAPPGSGESSGRSGPEGLQSLAGPSAPEYVAAVPQAFYTGFAITCAVRPGAARLVLLAHGCRAVRDPALLVTSVMPLGILTFVVLGVILFGITTATESAAVGAAGRLPDGLAGEDADLAEDQGSGVPHRQDDRHGLLAVRRLGPVLGGVRAARRPADHRAVGARHEPDAAAVPAARAGDHLHPRLAARVDRDHRHLRADLPAAAAALPDRSAAVRHAGVREPAGRVPVAAGGDVGLLPEGRVAQARDAQPDLRGHDAVHAIVILCMFIMYLWPGLTLWLPKYLYG